MKPKLLSWNVRGLNEGDKRLRVKNLLRQWKPNIICLKEFKLELISSSVVRSLLGCQRVDWCPSASRGASGGILLMWDWKVLEKIEECVGGLLFPSPSELWRWFLLGFCGVYGPNSDVDRRHLWEELASLLNWWNLLWCIGGDFNVTCFPSERLGEARFSSVMMEFPNFISWIFPL